jgi:hypothetical protein
VAQYFNRFELRSITSVPPEPVSGFRRGLAWIRRAPLPGSIALVLTAALSIVWPALLGAHEAGTTRVVASFTANRTYAIELTTDASTLLARLEAASKKPRSSPVTAADYRRGFTLLCGEISRHLEAVFDGAPAPVSPTCIVDDAVGGADPALSSLGVTIRFGGPIPDGATTFTWQYGLTATSYALMIVSSDGRTDSMTWLEGEQVGPVASLARLTAPVRRAGAASRYLRLGFTRFLPNGLGQVLFVLGLVLLTRRLTSILWQVGLFTLAHSAGLGLAYCRIVSPSASIVEALVILSVIYIACDNLVSPRLRPSRVVLIAAFGLVHGVALTDALQQLSRLTPPSPGDLLWFSAGIETGQLALILAAGAVVGGWASQRERHRQMVAVPASAVIATTGLLWMLGPIGL